MIEIKDYSKIGHRIANFYLKHLRTVQLRIFSKTKSNNNKHHNNFIRIKIINQNISNKMELINI